MHLLSLATINIINTPANEKLEIHLVRDGGGRGKQAASSFRRMNFHSAANTPAAGAAVST